MQLNLRKLGLLVIVLINCHFVLAQRNKLTLTEISNIKINNMNFDDLIVSSSILSELNSKIGGSFIYSNNNTVPSLNREYDNGKILISFQDDSNTGNEFYLSYFDIYNPAISIKVKGVNVRIGDSITKLGNYPLFNQDGEKVLLFTDYDTETIGLFFHLNDNLEIISIIFDTF